MNELEGKIARLERELAQARAEAGMPAPSAEPVADFEAWFRAVELGDGDAPLPTPDDRKRWDEYVIRHALALGAWKAAIESSKLNAAVGKAWDRFEKAIDAASQPDSGRMAELESEVERLRKDAAAEALRHAAQVVELFDDATMKNDYMIDSKDCAAILEGLAEYHAALAAKGEQS